MAFPASPTARISPRTIRVSICLHLRGLGFCYLETGHVRRRRSFLHGSRSRLPENFIDERLNTNFHLDLQGFEAIAKFYWHRFLFAAVLEHKAQFTGCVHGLAAGAGRFHIGALVELITMQAPV